ncbi:uncharacterized protein TNCV_1358991 [Trichonephila clavipes]|nr:uncharacterized protein TNCV_1358991 [Trichonephila clavipes]
MGCHCLQYTVTPSIDSWHHHSLALMSMTSCNHVWFHSYNGSQEPFFNKTMLSLTRQGYHKTVSTLLRPPELSLIENIWDHLGRRVGHPKLEARLQQIWNEISQDIIQSLYAPMPDRIASCLLR